MYKFKLQRPSGRWSYKTTPKPRVTIRKQDNEQNEATPPSVPQPQYVPNSLEDEQSALRREDHEQAEDFGVERTIKPEISETASTIKVQISTPADFSDVYYEIATIRSPYTFQVIVESYVKYISNDTD